MKSLKTKRIIRTSALIVVSLAFWIFALYTVQCLLVPKYQSGVVEGSMIAEYYDNPTGHQVLMVGDCEVYENISTVELWKKYGITSYIRGSAQQLVWQSYYLLEDSLRYETPDVVVFNVLSLKYNEPQSEAYNRMSIDGMRWSLSKLGAITASMTEDEKLADYLFPLLRYHSRWSELTADDFQHIYTKDTVTHNGYYMRVDSKPESEFPDPMPLSDYTLGENAMGYLDKMTALCKEKGIDLVLIKAPTLYPHWYDEWDSQIVDYAAENSLSYLNFIKARDEIGLDMSVDTYDAGLHLNLSGAEKLADYLGAWLVENCDLDDMRSDDATATLWEGKLDRYEQAKAAQYKEIEENGKIISFAPIEGKESNILKNFAILAALAAICVALIACSPAAETKKTDKTGDKTQSTVSAPNAPTPKTDGYVLKYNNTDIAVDADMKDIVAALGEPTKYFESESCAFQGLDKVYTYGSVVIRTYPQGGRDYVLNIQLKDDTVSTAEGIYIGDSKEAVEVKYGTPTKTSDVALTYVKGGSTLTFIFDGSTLSSITYQSDAVG